MPIGIELVFSRDLVCKLTQDEKIKGELRRQRLLWHVAGSFDFLQIRPVETLESIGSALNNSGTVAIGAHTGIVLVFPGKNIEKEFAERFSGLIATPANSPSLKPNNGRSSDRQRYPVLYGARISLSPIAYEFGRLYSGVLASIQAAITILQRAIQAKRDRLPENMIIMQTLGNSDLVLLALPENVKELCEVDALMQIARCIGLNELHAATHADDLDSPSGSADTHGPDRGHAFAAVTEFVALRYSEDDTFHFDGSDDRSVGTRIDYRLYLDCGHDAWVKNKLAANGLSVNGTGVESASRHWLGRDSVRGSVNTLEDLFALWKMLWLDHDFRSANLIHSSAELSFPDVMGDPEAHVADHSNKPAWKITDEVWTDLSAIESNLNKWATRFLSATQRREFLNTIGTFRSCFFHHELASAARDLVPFLRQLARACAPELFPVWANFRALTSFERFTDEISALLSHLHRAVRNRIEHRSGYADPTLPHTLEHGASKLVGAYSAMSWLCGELFSVAAPRGQEVATDDYCYAQNHAVCVSAGTEGRVRFSVLFSDFSSFCEMQKVNRRLPADRNWTTALLLLEISGKSLFRPEMSMIHCLQETAQYSNWWRSAGTDVVRVRINNWVTRTYVTILVDLTTAHASKGGSPGLAGSDALIEELEIYLLNVALPYVLELALKANSGPPKAPLSASFLERGLYPEVKSFLDALKCMDPVHFANRLGDGISQYLEYHGTWGQADTAYRKSRGPKVPDRPMLEGSLRDALSGRQATGDNDEPPESFDAARSDLCTIVNEVVADIGMWCAFDHVVSVGKPHERHAPTRLMDVNIIFSHILRAMYERTGQYITQAEVDLFGLRWAIQAAAVAEPLDWGNAMMKWLSEKCGGLLAALEREHIVIEWSRGKWLRDYPEIFDAKSRLSLVGALRWISPDTLKRDLVGFPHYTNAPAMRSLQFTPVAKLGAAERQLWGAFVDAWRAHRNQYEPGAREGGSDEILAKKRALQDAQIRLVMHMWAKSVRMCYVRAFEEIAEDVDVVV